MGSTEVTSTRQRVLTGCSGACTPLVLNLVVVDHGVEISSIKIPDGRRTLCDIEPLIESIREVGLVNPITVTPDRVLVAGYHRLEACRALGWKTIDAIVVTLDKIDAELAAIDEKLCRTDMTAIERIEAIARRKQLCEAKHPEAKRGRSRREVAVGEPG